MMTPIFKDQDGDAAILLTGKYSDGHSAKCPEHLWREHCSTGESQCGYMLCLGVGRQAVRHTSEVRDEPDRQSQSWGASSDGRLTVFMFSIQIASTGPSNMIHFLSGCVSAQHSRM